MAFIEEQLSYDENIYQISTDDIVIGGPEGISNKAAKGLTNRTAWLKKQAQSFLTEPQINDLIALQLAGGSGLQQLTEISFPAQYPFADNVIDGDIVYLFYDYDVDNVRFAVEYRKAKEIDNGAPIYKANSQQVDYGLYTSIHNGFADTTNNRIYQSTLPIHVSPKNLAPNKEWWLSRSMPGTLQSTQPFANRDPIGWTDNEGSFHTFKGLLVNRLVSRGDYYFKIEATQGEDISHRVRHALRYYPAVEIVIPKGVIAEITHSRIVLNNRLLRVIVNGKLHCKHRTKHNPYLNSGDWFLISSFVVGATSSLLFGGIGDIHHQIADVGANNLAPYNYGLVSGSGYTQGTAQAPSIVVCSGGVNVYLATSFFNHMGGGSRFELSVMGSTMRREATYLNPTPTIASRGSWSYAAGRLAFNITSVTFLDGVVFGTPSNSEGDFNYLQLTPRTPNFQY